MGDFKPLLPLGKKTVLENLIDTLIKAGISEISVVTGFQRRLISPFCLEKNGVKEAYNPNFDEGMFTSVKSGILSITASSGAFLLPVDYPLVSATHIGAMQATINDNPDCFVVPCYRGKKGHPLWIPAAAFEEILAYDGEGGLKGITREYEAKGKLLRVEIGAEEVVMDMDTKEDYGEILAFYGMRDEVNRPRNPHWKDYQGRIFLVRHGDIKKHPDKIFLGQYDALLSEQGRAEAAAAAETLISRGARPRAIYTSDLSRARETAEVIAKKLSGLAASAAAPASAPPTSGLLEVIDEPAFRELSLGDWDGALIKDIKAQYPEEYERRGREILTYKRPEPGENFYDLQYRVMKRFNQILETELTLQAEALDESQGADANGNRGQPDILIVSHSGVIKVILCNLIGLDLESGLGNKETGLSNKDAGLGDNEAGSPAIKVERGSVTLWDGSVISL